MRYIPFGRSGIPPSSQSVQGLEGSLRGKMRCLNPDARQTALRIHSSDPTRAIDAWRIATAIPYLWPPKTDFFKKLYTETIIRNPKKVSFSGHTLNSKPFSICFPLNYRGKIVARVSLWSGERALWIQLTNFTGRAWGFLIIGILDAAHPQALLRWLRPL